MEYEIYMLCNILGVLAVILIGLYHLIGNDTFNIID